MSRPGRLRRLIAPAWWLADTAALVTVGVPLLLYRRLARPRP